MIDAAIKVWPQLDGFLARDEPDGTDASFLHLAECLITASREPEPA